jgi:hypothetical protein
MSSPASAICPNCGASLTGAYCAACGEKRFDHHSLSLAHFLEHAFEAFVHFDGAIIRTLKALVLRPGQLTADYVQGRRKPYLAPVQFFLLMNVIYFAATALNGWNTLNTNLVTHVTWTEHKPIARRMVREKLAATKQTFAEYQRKFDARGGVQAKSLVIAMVPLFALFCAGLQFHRRGYLVEHLVFSLHFYTFLLLFLSVSTSITTLVLSRMNAAGWRPDDVAIDNVTSTISLWCVLAYLYFALRRTNVAERWYVSALQSLVLTVAFMAVLMAFRFGLFLATFYTT